MLFRPEPATGPLPCPLTKTPAAWSGFVLKLDFLFGVCVCVCVCVCVRARAHVCRGYVCVVWDLFVYV